MASDNLTEAINKLGSTAMQGKQAYDSVKTRVGRHLETAREHVNGEGSLAMKLASQAYETAAATALAGLRKVCASLPVGGKKRNYTRRKY
jgi:hypothetical protein